MLLSFLLSTFSNIRDETGKRIKITFYKMIRIAAMFRDNEGAKKEKKGERKKNGIEIRKKFF